MPKRPLLIGNDWVDARDTIVVKCPHTGGVVGECAKAGPAELERAVEAAVRGFATSRGMSSARRSDLLKKTAAGLERRREEIARTITSENAKPIRLSRVEVDRAVATFTASAEEAKRVGGEVLPLDLAPGGEGRVGITRRLPLGPVLAISPFNFPLNLVAHKVGPAIAAGNSVVLKPASSTPLTALLLGEVLLEAGMPPGLVNIVPCSAADADRLVADERFRVLTFTGSPAVGWELRKKAGRKRVILELGGNAAVIVHEDADLELAAERAVQGAFVYSGQVCISVQRIYVHDAVYDAFAKKAVAKAAALVAGDPFDERTQLGPLIDDAAAARTQAWVDEAVKGGARLLCGGRRQGRHFPATLLEQVTREMKVHCAELFAPVANLYRYPDFDSALAAVNDSPFGLQAGLFTRDVGRVFRAFRELEVGGVLHNESPTWRIDTMPYGGEKESGLGREGVRYALEEMTQLRLLAINPS
jgi:glyceraldehyde-3-phosphate dehydrogenase (NADP+)